MMTWFVTQATVLQMQNIGRYYAFASSFGIDLFSLTAKYIYHSIKCCGKLIIRQIIKQTMLINGLKYNRNVFLWTNQEWNIRSVKFVGRVCYLPKFSILASMFVWPFVCLCVCLFVCLSVTSSIQVTVFDISLPNLAQVCIYVTWPCL